MTAGEDLMVRTGGPPVHLRPVSTEEYLDFVARAPAVNFMQCPSWAEVKPGWNRELLGWFDAGYRLVGCVLVLYRPAPVIRRSLAYIPAGPVIDWSAADLSVWLRPLLDHVAARGAFAVRMTPPLFLRRWDVTTVRAGIRDPAVNHLGELAADQVDAVATHAADRLRTMGWRTVGGEGTEGTRRLVHQLPLAGHDLDGVWAGLSQSWRRNVRRAEREGVRVERGGYDDLPDLYDLLRRTEERNGFSYGRSLAYYQRQYRALTAEDPDRMRLYLARRDGELLAAHTLNLVGRCAWYHLGGSAGHDRKARPSNALQWRMISDAHARGCAVYDLGVVRGTLDEGAPGFGVLGWKLGLGGEVAQNLGEWEFPVSRPLTWSMATALRAGRTARNMRRAARRVTRRAARSAGPLRPGGGAWVVSDKSHANRTGICQTRPKGNP
jgi:lipid II:glycine glycyltransferase (peptidoglycan interpeptide bridge formation enzyme)